MGFLYLCFFFWVIAWERVPIEEGLNNVVIQSIVEVAEEVEVFSQVDSELADLSGNQAGEELFSVACQDRII